MCPYDDVQYGIAEMKHSETTEFAHVSCSRQAIVVLMAMNCCYTNIALCHRCVQPISTTQATYVVVGVGLPLVVWVIVRVRNTIVVVIIQLLEVVLSQTIDSLTFLLLLILCTQ